MRVADYADELAFQMRAVGLPEFCREWRFDAVRRWRFDAAWPERMLAVECDGGQWKPGGGRHNTDADREKLNAAAVLGWRVLRFSGDQVRDGSAVTVIEQALGVTHDS